MRYFAYGSNMSLPRLKERVPSAERIGVFELKEHVLKFHKISTRDKSGKCDAFLTGRSDDSVIGVVFEISDEGKEVLDKVEGVGNGYEIKSVWVANAQGKVVEAIAYVATEIDSLLLPYSWYLYHVIYGAKESGFPDDYVKLLEATNSIEDPNKDRDIRERAIYS